MTSSTRHAVWNVHRAPVVDSRYRQSRSSWQSCTDRWRTVDHQPVSERVLVSVQPVDVLLYGQRQLLLLTDRRVLVNESVKLSNVNRLSSACYFGKSYNIAGAVKISVAQIRPIAVGEWCGGKRCGVFPTMQTTGGGEVSCRIDDRAMGRNSPHSDDWGGCNNICLTIGHDMCGYEVITNEQEVGGINPWGEHLWRIGGVGLNDALQICFREVGPSIMPTGYGVEVKANKLEHILKECHTIRALGN